LPLADWPARDRRRWQALLCRDNRSVGRPEWPHWSPVRTEAIQGSYARWLKWLSIHHSEILSLSPGARMRMHIVQEYIEDQRQRIADISLVSTLYNISIATEFLDRRHQRDWMKPVLTILRRAKPCRRRKAERIVPPQDLLDFGIDLMRSNRKAGTLDRTRAIRYRDGLIIALLAMRPLRLANFVDLALGDHVVTRHGEIWIHIPRSTTKNRLELEFPFPRKLQEFFDFYLKEVRPWFLAQASKHAQPQTACIWISLWGRPLDRNTLGVMVRTRTLQKFGRAVNPHLFRDCLATSIATQEPHLAWTTQLLLGHRSHLTSQKHYLHTDLDLGQSTFLSHLEELRRKRL
jgi:integrase/recombinase XerD